MLFYQKLECSILIGVTSMKQGPQLALPLVVFSFEDGCHVTQYLHDVGFGQMTKTHQI